MTAPSEREAISRIIYDETDSVSLVLADRIIAEHIEPLRALLREAIQIIDIYAPERFLKAIEFLNKESPNE